MWNMATSAGAGISLKGKCSVEPIVALSREKKATLLPVIVIAKAR